MLVIFILMLIIAIVTFTAAFAIVTFTAAFAKIF